MADQDLTITAARLARNNPQDWRQFMIALADHTEMVRNNCVTSPLPELPVNQGKAQALTDLTLRLGKCTEEADRAIQRQERKL